MDRWERLANALGFATQLHATQKRKGSGVPYISHLLAVAAIVLEHGGTEDEAIAALLHDAVEDQGGQATLALIRDRYGDTVAAIVAGCTDTDEVHKPSWRPRKERYLAHFADAPPSVLLVVAADKLHNARSVLADYRELGDALWPRFTGNRDGTLWYYRAVADALRARAQSGSDNLKKLVADLNRTVDELERAAVAPRQ
ncbi:MAG: metal dependent phosphohydrolase [Thermomicrobiales bacterium]|jgi:(p)ppGpp synthase/HD superfamily hydrolase|nr:metal dependent phosphohydrolase [Thermomicrobiales bacterium]